MNNQFTDKQHVGFLLPQSYQENSISIDLIITGSVPGALSNYQSHLVVL